MKNVFALILTAVLILSVLSACSININLTKPTESPATQAPAPTAAATSAPETAAPATEAPAPIGTLSDYVKTAKEKDASFGDGSTNTMRVPEIMLDSSDARSANAEIAERFDPVFTDELSHAGATTVDYEASLNGAILSVVVTAKYNGGNSYGLCYAFDVAKGDGLDSESLCKAIDKDYAKALGDLKSELEDYYEDKWGALPGNDTEKAKTFADENLKAAKFYLDADGDLMAMTDIYAAVGGGHWIALLEL